AACRDERRSLAVGKPLRLGPGQPGLERQRVVDQRHDRPRGMQPCGDFRQGSEGETVDDDRMSGSGRLQARLGIRLLRGGRAGKAIAQADDIDIPIELFQFGDDAAVVGIAAGSGRDVAWYRPGYAPGHSAASYQARATCDSET